MTLPVPPPGTFSDAALQEGAFKTALEQVNAALTEQQTWVTGPIGVTPTQGNGVLVWVSATQVRLQRLGGITLTINGAGQTIPSAGVTLGTGGLVANTTYYVYAWMSAGTMTLEAVTTVHAMHTDGVEIKTGDPTRTLVGMVRTTAAIQFADSATQRFVRSWFHDPGIAGVNVKASNTATSSAALTELNAALRVELLVWVAEVFTAQAWGSYVNNINGMLSHLQLAFEGGGIGIPAQSVIQSGPSDALASGYAGPWGVEGYHYVTMWAAAGGGGSTTFLANYHGVTVQTNGRR